MEFRRISLLWWGPWGAWTAVLAQTEQKCCLRWWAITSLLPLPVWRVLLDTQAVSLPYKQHLGKTQWYFFFSQVFVTRSGSLSEVSRNMETKPRKSWVVWAKGRLCRSLRTRSRTWINCWTRDATCSICPVESAKRVVCTECFQHPGKDSVMWTTG